MKKKTSTKNKTKKKTSKKKKKKLLKSTEKAIKKKMTPTKKTKLVEDSGYSEDSEGNFGAELSNMAMGDGAGSASDLVDDEDNGSDISDDNLGDSVSWGKKKNLKNS